MKRILDWQAKDIVNIYDEVSLWSAPFGRLLLENIPMRPGLQILDIGFGTGFPLVELGQRFGESAKVYGIDIWVEGIKRTQAKIDLLELDGIEILDSSAVNIALPDQHIDLITSNLGVNNFDEREEVYAEMHRVLKADGVVAITTNPVGTFEELFELFSIVLGEMDLEDELRELVASIQRRNTKSSIESEFNASGFELVRSKSDATHMRFSDAKALMDHVLIRIGFRQSWEQMVRAERRSEFFERLVEKIAAIILKDGYFKMKIPMLYLEFQKRD